MKALLTLAASCLLTFPVFAQTWEVKQVMDMKADSLDAMYQYVPDYLEIQPGDTIRFVGSMGSHTVHTIDNMLPDGAEPVAIRYKPSYEVKFAEEGVYGLKCKVHHRYGMVGLIVVGSPEGNLEQATEAAMSKLGKRSRPKMQRLLERATGDFNNL